MKRKIQLFSSILCLPITIFAQLNTVNVYSGTQTLESAVVDIYDSTRNSPILIKDHSCLVGQEVYVLPLPIEKTIYAQNRADGYEGFKTMDFKLGKDKYTAKRYGKAAPNNKNNTRAEDLENKVFIIRDISHTNDKYPYYCLMLQEKENAQNVCQFIYKSSTKYNITFATLKHIQYLKSTCINNFYYFDAQCLYTKDIETGKDLKMLDERPWLCEDIIISPESGKLTMKVSSNGDVTYLREYAGAMKHSTDLSVLEELVGYSGSAKQDLNTFFTIAYSANTWNKLAAEYGIENMWLALKHRVVKGMPYSLVKMALGMPKSKDVSSEGTICYYSTLEHVLDIEVPFVYYQNGKMDMQVVFNNEGLVTLWF